MKPKIHIVNYEEGRVENGILTKHARAMERELQDLDYEVTVSNKPDPKADINHHINYIAAQPCPTLNTCMVTHFTSDMYKLKDKLDKMRKFLINGVGICFSQAIKDYLIKQGMPEKKLEVVLPAHDGMIRRPRIIALAFKVYPDGRKREEMFYKMFLSLKDKKKFIFRIIGAGWKPLLEKLSAKGIQVQWTDQFNMDLYEQVLNSSDYLLYTGGEDAIAQCIVDAKNAGLRIIAPPQTDVEVDIPWQTQEELNKIFQDMEINPVEKWTWENYTKNHIKIWENMHNSTKKKK
jgi:hypothetical protein